MPDTAATTDPAVSRLAVRLPPFWPHNPTLWFAQVEASFLCAGISADSTKFALVVSQLDHQYAGEVQDIITSPPAANCYDRLKTELIRRVSTSQEERIRQVLTQEEIGDRKPSQFLRHLRSKVDAGTVPDNLLRTIWSNRLPPSVKAIIASQTDMPLDAVAELADKIQEAVTPVPVNAITAHCASATATVSRTDYDALAAKVDLLTQQISQLLSRQESSRERRHSRFRRRSHSRSSTASSAATPDGQVVCWYHRKFGEQARKCTSPCAYPNASGGRK